MSGFLRRCWHALLWPYRKRDSWIQEVGEEKDKIVTSVEHSDRDMGSKTAANETSKLSRQKGFIGLPLAIREILEKDAEMEETEEEGTELEV